MADQPAVGTALVLGATGQLGRELRLAVAEGLGARLAQHWVWADREVCDLTQPAHIQHCLQQHQPGLIINAAAYTAVDRAESEPDLAHRINAAAVAELAHSAQVLGAVMVHFSTDYVFDGRLDRPYLETDAPHPQSVYGRTKLQGEQALAAALERHLILRTSWVFARHGGNFLKTMLKLAQERDTLRVVSDQWGAPTSARLLARQSLQACAQALGSTRAEPRWGLYHLTCQGHTHWQAYAVHVLTQAARWGMKLRVQPDQVQAISTAQYPTPAHRPMNSRLDGSLWQRTWGQSLPSWQSEVDQVLADVLLDQGVLTPAMRSMITSVRSAQ
jgi:dTDP-4-dehydrorhamnose reductase